jgi:predicted esterase
VPVDPTRLAIGGESYALSLGRANCDLFECIQAFSPSFAAPPDTVGQPRIYVSFCAEDDVLPIGPCGGRPVLRLRRSGYTVRYDEFE